MAKTFKDPLERAILKLIANSFLYIGDLNMNVVNLMQDFNVLLESIEKLQKGKDLEELKQQIKRVESERLEITLNVPKNIEKALEEFLKAVERAKKGQGQHIQ